MKIFEIKKIIEKVLDNNKAQKIVIINLKNKSYIADYMIVASGTSSRHLQSLSENLVSELKKLGIPVGITIKVTEGMKKYLQRHRERLLQND